MYAGRRTAISGGDDAAHPDYYRREQLPTTATSFAYLKQQDKRYRSAVVIDCKRDPVVPGDSSAIFIHIRRPDGRPTAGCIGLDEADLLARLRCFPKYAKPLIDIRLLPE